MSAPRGATTIVGRRPRRPAPSIIMRAAATTQCVRLPRSFARSSLHPPSPFSPAVHSPAVQSASDPAASACRSRTIARLRCNVALSAASAFSAAKARVYSSAALVISPVLNAALPSSRSFSAESPVAPSAAMGPGDISIVEYSDKAVFSSFCDIYRYLSSSSNKPETHTGNTHTH